MFASHRGIRQLDLRYQWQWNHQVFLLLDPSVCMQDDTLCASINDTTFQIGVENRVYHYLSQL
jgi:hypothetical protein